MGVDALIFALAFSLAATSEPSRMVNRPLTVDEITTKYDELDGKTIQVTGVLRACRQSVCAIADNTSEGAKHLGVDLSKEAKFDTDTLLRHRIVVQGRFEASCLRPGAICLDSVIELHDARIVETP